MTKTTEVSFFGEDESAKTLEGPTFYSGAFFTTIPFSLLSARANDWSMPCLLNLKPNFRERYYEFFETKTGCWPSRGLIIEAMSSFSGTWTGILGN